MKIIELAKRIDKDKSVWIDLDTLADELSLEHSYEWMEQDRLQCYWLGSWYCTDTHVGYKIYFFDNEPVAISSQHGRKCDENFFWASESVAQEIKDYLITIRIVDSLNIETMDFYNDDIGESFTIEYNSQVLQNTLKQYPVFYEGHQVKIIHFFKECKYGIDKKVTIQFKDESVKDVQIDELGFSYYIVNNV